MKELNKKVFNTIFIILSIFLIVGILFYNQKQYFALVLSIFFCLFIIGVVAYITKYRLW